MKTTVSAFRDSGAPSPAANIEDASPPAPSLGKNSARGVNRTSTIGNGSRIVKKNMSIDVSDENDIDENPKVNSTFKSTGMK